MKKLLVSASDVLCLVRKYLPIPIWNLAGGSRGGGRVTRSGYRSVTGGNRNRNRNRNRNTRETLRQQLLRASHNRGDDDDDDDDSDEDDEDNDPRGSNQNLPRSQRLSLHEIFLTNRSIWEDDDIDLGDGGLIGEPFIDTGDGESVNSAGDFPSDGEADTEDNTQPNDDDDDDEDPEEEIVDRPDIASDDLDVALVFDSEEFLRYVRIYPDMDTVLMTSKLFDDVCSCVPANCVWELQTNILRHYRCLSSRLKARFSKDDKIWKNGKSVSKAPYHDFPNYNIATCTACNLRCTLSLVDFNRRSLQTDVNYMTNAQLQVILICFNYAKKKRSEDHQNEEAAAENGEDESEELEEPMSEDEAEEERQKKRRKMYNEKVLSEIPEFTMNMDKGKPVPLGGQVMFNFAENFMDGLDRLARHDEELYVHRSWLPHDQSPESRLDIVSAARSLKHHGMFVLNVGGVKNVLTMSLEPFTPKCFAGADVNGVPRDPKNSFRRWLNSSFDDLLQGFEDLWVMDKQADVEVNVYFDLGLKIYSMDRDRCVVPLKEQSHAFLKDFVKDVEVYDLSNQDDDGVRALVHDFSEQIPVSERATQQSSLSAYVGQDGRIHPAIERDIVEQPNHRDAVRSTKTRLPKTVSTYSTFFSSVIGNATTGSASILVDRPLGDDGQIQKTRHTKFFHHLFFGEPVAGQVYTETSRQVKADYNFRGMPKVCALVHYLQNLFEHNLFCPIPQKVLKEGLLGAKKELGALQHYKSVLSQSKNFCGREEFTFCFRYQDPWITRMKPHNPGEHFATIDHAKFTRLVGDYAEKICASLIGIVDEVTANTSLWESNGLRSTHPATKAMLMLYAEVLAFEVGEIPMEGYLSKQLKKDFLAKGFRIPSPEYLVEDIPAGDKSVYGLSHGLDPSLLETSAMSVVTSERLRNLRLRRNTLRPQIDASKKRRKLPQQLACMSALALRKSYGKSNTVSLIEYFYQLKVTTLAFIDYGKSNWFPFLVCKTLFLLT